MSNTINCPSCQRTLRVPDELLGQLVKCPTCSQTFTAGADAEGPARPPDERPSARRRPRHEEEEDEDDDRPRRRAGRKPEKVQAIAIMTLVGGILALLTSLGLLAVGLGTCVFLAWPGTYFSLVLGIMATVKGSQLLGSDARRAGSPRATAIMQIINVLNCDLINLTLGIVILVFLGDPQVKKYFGE